MDSPYILTVGALQRVSELEIPGANFGDCVDVFAPGEDISAPLIGPSDSEVGMLTGSSASAAIMTGMAAHLMAQICNPGLIYPGSGLSIYEEMIRNVEERQYIMFVRNILLGSRAELTKSSMSYTNNVRSYHAGSNVYCDIRWRSEIPRYCISQIEILQKKNDRPKVFQKVKSNMADHIRRKAEEFYA
jgi:hypothetical protein